jgi:hypothetical protein
MIMGGRGAYLFLVVFRFLLFDVEGRMGTPPTPRAAELGTYKQMDGVRSSRGADGM